MTMQILDFETGFSKKSGRPVLSLSAIADPVPDLDASEKQQIDDEVKARYSSNISDSAELTKAATELERLQVALAAAEGEKESLLTEQRGLERQRLESLRAGDDVKKLESKLRSVADRVASVDARLGDLRPMVVAAAKTVHSTLSGLLTPIDRPVVEMGWEAVCEALDAVYREQVQEQQRQSAWLTAKNAISRELSIASRGPEQLRQFLDSILSREVQHA